ncbi:MAG TPA: bifunctional ornithine acetyltransferase/N-acetylglutamate synthase [Bacillota bacterium]
MTVIKNKIKKMNDGSVVSPAGFQVAGIHSGVKRKRNDLGIIVCDVPATAAAMYTTNNIQAAPIKVTKESIGVEGKLQAVIVNSGNANACTGEKGERDAYAMRNEVAKTFSIKEHHIAVGSTGVIGEEMPMDKIIPSIKSLKLGKDPNDAEAFNQSILTTDTVNKSSGYEATIDGKQVRIAGAAKGSGMIAPNMATMLAFVTTDVAIDSDVLQQALRQVTDQTFNCITVDGDTSTNDMVLAMASGHAGNERLTPQHKDWSVFMEMLHRTCEDLAKMIARDGEGATTLIEAEVNGAKNRREAIKVAKSIVGSSLVKTAVFGADANWGRILAAIGYSGATIDPNTIDIFIGDVALVKESKPVTYDEKEVFERLRNDFVKITVDLHVGAEGGKAWGCDLTYDYVQINASYRT